MTPEEETRNHLIKAVEVRGTQARVAEALGVTDATVKRWVEGETITAAALKMLRLYFFGEMPFDLVHKKQDKLSSILKFTPEEWRIIEVLALREGQEPGQWIKTQIVGYLDHHPKAQAARESLDSSKSSNLSLLAEPPATYVTKAKSRKT